MILKLSVIQILCKFLFLFKIKKTAVQRKNEMKKVENIESVATDLFSIYCICMYIKEYTIIYSQYLIKRIYFFSTILKYFFFF